MMAQTYKVWCQEYEVCGGILMHQQFRFYLTLAACRKGRKGMKPPGAFRVNDPIKLMVNKKFHDWVSMKTENQPLPYREIERMVRAASSNKELQ